MSNNLIRGKDVLLFVVSGGSDYPIICAKSCTIERVFEEIETTHYASTETEWTTGMSTTVVSLDGVLTAEAITAGDYTPFDFWNGGLFDMKMVFTAPSGADKTATFAAIVPRISLTGDVSDFAGFSLGIKASGGVAIA